MSLRVGAHQRVFEYDGAFGCLDCDARWGAFTGAPEQPPPQCSYTRATMPTSPPDPALALLRELVACKDLKEQFERVKRDETDGDSISIAGHIVLNGLAKEYQRRKPLVWAAARALLKERG